MLAKMVNKYIQKLSDSDHRHKINWSNIIWNQMNLQWELQQARNSQSMVVGLRPCMAYVYTDDVQYSVEEANNENDVTIYV